jgi:dolichol-phosphate mannosyltransferase
VTSVWVVIPTYEEAESIAAVCTALREHTVLVVDDNSPDGTARIAEAAGARVLRRPGRAGLAAAYRAGFAEALGHGAEVIVQMDADGSHDPADVARLVAAVDAGADVAVGSRYVPGGGTPGWSALRRLVSRGGGLYARLVLGSRVHDLTAGFKAWRAGALRAVAPPRASGYAFQIEMTWGAERAGLQVVELPIVFRERELGQSKMSVGIALEAVWRVPLLLASRRRCTTSALSPAWTSTPGASSKARASLTSAMPVIPSSSPPTTTPTAPTS